MTYRLQHGSEMPVGFSEVSHFSETAPEAAPIDLWPSEFQFARNCGEDSEGGSSHL